MFEFLRVHLDELQLIAAIVIAFNWRKCNAPVLRYFPIMYLYLALNDYGAQLYTYLKIHPEGYNLILFNTFLILHLFYLLWLYSTFINTKLVVYFGYAAMIAVVLATGYELFVLKMNYHEVFNVFPYIIGGVSLLILILVYFFEALSSEEIIKIDRQPLFWISIAYFFYYIAFVPLKINQNFYIIHSDYISVMYLIKFWATIILNSILIFGFLWSNKQVEH